jgi:hypothetical protein
LNEEDILKIIRRSAMAEGFTQDQLRFYARYAAGVPGAALSLLSEDWLPRLGTRLPRFILAWTKNPSRPPDRRICLSGSKQNAYRFLAGHFAQPGPGRAGFF